MSNHFQENINKIADKSPKDSEQQSVQKLQYMHRGDDVVQRIYGSHPNSTELPQKDTNTSTPDQSHNSSGLLNQHQIFEYLNQWGTPWHTNTLSQSLENPAIPSQSENVQGFSSFDTPSTFQSLTPYKYSTNEGIDHYFSNRPYSDLQRVNLETTTQTKAFPLTTTPIGIESNELQEHVNQQEFKDWVDNELQERVNQPPHPQQAIGFPEINLTSYSATELPKENITDEQLLYMANALVQQEIQQDIRSKGKGKETIESVIAEESNVFQHYQLLRGHIREQQQETPLPRDEEDTTFSDTNREILTQITSIRPYPSSPRASLETNTQTEDFPLTMTPTGIESIMFPTQNSSLSKIQAHCDTILTKVRDNQPIRGLKLDAQGFDAIVAELHNRKKTNPADKDIIDQAIKTMTKKKYDQTTRITKATAEGFKSLYDKKNDQSFKVFGKKRSARQNELTLEKHKMTLQQRQNELTWEKHKMTPYQKQKQLIWEKHKITPKQRQRQLTWEKHKMTLWQRQNELAKNQGFSSVYQELERQIQIENFNNITDMLFQQASNQNLDISYNTFQNFEGLLRTQDELNNAFQEQTIAQSNELISQQQDSFLLTQHLQLQINDIDTQIENFLEVNDAIGYLLNWNEIDLLLDQLEVSDHLPETNGD